VKKVINHDNTFTEFGYDPAGRRSTVTDPMGRVTRYVYDRWGRLDTVVDPMNQSTRYSYDLMGNLLTLTDARLQTTTFEYDAHNRVQKTIYPGGAFETFTYDTRGRLATMIDRKNITTTYTYDDLGRLTGKSFTNDPTNTPAFSYTYDVAGRMLTAANGTDTLTWVYNLAGELLSEQSVKNASTVAYQYDAGGNRIEVKLDGTVFVTYAYDDASRLTTITRGANVFGFGYDNANRRTTMTYPNGVTTAYTYDELNRLTNLAATHVPTSTPITNFGYQYDAAGNRTQKSTLDYTEDYGYDPLYRLTRTDRTNPGATPQTNGPGTMTRSGTAPALRRIRRPRPRATTRRIS
jgi:YD repeat-containing protein